MVKEFVADHFLILVFGGCFPSPLFGGRTDIHKTDGEGLKLSDSVEQKDLPAGESVEDDFDVQFAVWTVNQPSFHCCYWHACTWLLFVLQFLLEAIASVY